MGAKNKKLPFQLITILMTLSIFLYHRPVAQAEECCQPTLRNEIPSYACIPEPSGCAFSVAGFANEWRIVA